jgi:hypothetical protein
MSSPSENPPAADNQQEKDADTEAFLAALNNPPVPDPDNPVARGLREAETSIRRGLKWGDPETIERERDKKAFVRERYIANLVQGLKMSPEDAAQLFNSMNQDNASE